MRHVLTLIIIVAAGALAPAANAQSLVLTDASTATSTSTVEELATDYCPQTDRSDDGGRRHTVKKNIKNVFGTVLAQYRQTLKWCFTGHPWAPWACEPNSTNPCKITWIDRDRGGSVYSLGWDFEGHIDSWGYGGTGDKVALRGTQGKFRLCGGGTCVQTKTPWIQHNVWGTGQYEWNTGW